MLGASLSMTSCSDDYLNTTPTGSTGTSTVFTSTDSAYGALNGIARMMTTQYSYYGQGFCGENGVWWIYENYPDENFYYNAYASGWSVIFNMDYMTRNNTIYDAYAWSYYYGIISNANSIIANIDAVEGEVADKEFIKASALTFRAYAFEKLTRYYCARWSDSNDGASQGLVLRLDESTGDCPYSTLGETFEQIYADLDSAIALFASSGIDRDASQVWIPNVNVAHAVYARAALGKQDFSTALSQAGSAKEGYDLMSVDDYQSGFCTPTSEWIMGSFGDSTENNWYYSFGTQFGANGYYAGNSYASSGQANINMLEKIPNDDARKAMFITADKFPTVDLNNILSTDNGGLLFHGLDADAADQLYAYVDAMTPSGLGQAYAYNRTSTYGSLYLGSHFKFYVIETPGIGYLPMIRTSEMVLVEAEANYFLGNTAAAQASLVELNASTGRDADYTTTKTGDDLWEEIVAYRGIELWGEGTTWSDYKRWNRPISRKGFADGGNAHATIAVDIATTHADNWTWAIPQAETDYNSALSNEADELE